MKVACMFLCEKNYFPLPSFVSAMYPKERFKFLQGKKDLE